MTRRGFQYQAVGNAHAVPNRRRPNKVRWFFSVLVFSIFAVALLRLGTPANAVAQGGDIYLVKLSGPINPGTAAFLTKNVRRASEASAACCIIQLDTPGGLAESMRSIVMAILASKVPVVVYVSPSGSRAASAGVMITMAADVAAMAPGTNMGAAHPVGSGGQDIGKTMAEKAVSDMAAYARSLAQNRGRNAEWAEKAIRESISATESEALKENIIDLVATDLEDLIQKLDGREIPGKGVLKTKGMTIVVLKEDLREKILKTISNPNIAYILMMIGLAGLYAEFSHPGAIFPGVVGAISLILAFFSFQTLPVNYAGILLIVLAVILFILEMKILSYGLLSIAGIASLLLGSLMLFNQGETGLMIAWSTLIPTVTVVSAFFVVVAALIFRAQTTRPKTGAQGLVGEIGVVQEAIDLEGKIHVHGELWNAFSSEPIATGTKVTVIGVERLRLKVEALR